MAELAHGTVEYLTGDDWLPIAVHAFDGSTITATCLDDPDFTAVVYWHEEDGHFCAVGRNAGYDRECFTHFRDSDVFEGRRP